MNVRNLTVSTSKNLNGSREFNRLRINNLNDFFSSYPNNLEYYAPPFKILAELEDQILFLDNPPSTIVCDYKPGGFILFDLVGIHEEGDLRIVTYSYTTSAS